MEGSPYMETRRAIVVVGMHRSGTSALSRVLSFYGFSQPSDVMFPKKDNPKGYWESFGCQELNDKILASLGGGWDDPGLLLLPGLSLKESRSEISLCLADRWRDEAMSVLQASFGDAPAIVLKDPRISLLLPLWQRALKDAGYEPYFVLAYRNPLEVAASLCTRDGIGLIRALRLWLQHNMEVLIAGISNVTAAVAYYDMLNDPDTALAPLFVDLPHAGVALSSTDRAARTEFLSPADRHHIATSEELECSPVVAALIKDVWKLLQSWHSTPLAARISALEGLQSSYEDVMLLSGWLGWRGVKY